MSLSLPEVRLLIPQLFEPLILWEKDFQFKPEAPHLSKLLAQFETLAQVKTKGANASLFASVGIYAEELPTAYYRFQSQIKLSKTGGDVISIESIIQSGKQLVCADPVHLEVGINDITLTQKITDLSKEQAIEIINALNEHFEQDGFQFYYGADDQWYLSLDADESLSTTPVDEVVRKNIVSYLPTSKTVNWKMIQNEVQMLLHSLPVNMQRENEGLPMINSLWFWGGGQPQAAKKNISAIISTSQSMGDTLAQAVNCECQFISKDSDMETVFGTLTDNNIIILDQLSQVAVNDDIDTYQQELQHLDETIIKPLSQLWQAGKITLVVDGCDGQALKPTKVAAWAVWKKKSRPLSDIAKDILKEMA